MPRARAILAFVSLLVPSIALGNGAFPDSFSIFAPPSAPEQIILGTNRGLMLSTDYGETFHFVCEAAIAPEAGLYQVGPAPDHLIMGVSWAALAISRDTACTWEHAGDALAGHEVTDAFPDPSDPDRILAIARPKTSTGTFGLYESLDGGRTWPKLLLQVERGTTLQSVEIARSEPNTVYASWWSGFPPHPFVARSTNGMQTFETSDVGVMFGMRNALIAAIDVEDPQTIYFRLLGGDGNDAFAISNDGARTGRVALELQGRMTAFLRRANGDLVVGGRNDSFISSDGGMTFKRWESAPHIRGLAERDGIIYAATDNFVDGFAAATSSDDGRTWTPLTRYEDAIELLQCGDYATKCAEAIAELKTILQPPPPPPSDAGVPEPPPPTNESSGCDCSSAGGSAGANAALLIAIMIVLRRKKSLPRY